MEHWSSCLRNLVVDQRYLREMCPKRGVGCWKLPRDDLGCRCILLRWQLTHVRVQAVMSFFIACHTNFSVTSCTVARMDGWDKKCIISKMFRLKDFGTNGRGHPVLMSQSREVFSDLDHFPSEVGD